MKISRKNFLHLTAAGAAGSLLAPRAAAGQAKSTKVTKAPASLSRARPTR